MSSVKTNLLQRFAVLIFAVILFAACSNSNQTLKIYLQEDGKIQFAGDEIISVLNKKT
mgnify:CR=1 FL=1